MALACIQARRVRSSFARLRSAVAGDWQVKPRWDRPGECRRSFRCVVNTSAYPRRSVRLPKSCWRERRSYRYIPRGDNSQHKNDNWRLQRRSLHLGQNGFGATLLGRLVHSALPDHAGGRAHRRPWRGTSPQVMCFFVFSAVAFSDEWGWGCSLSVHEAPAKRTHQECW